MFLYVSKVSTSCKIWQGYLGFKRRLHFSNCLVLFGRRCMILIIVKEVLFASTYIYFSLNKKLFSLIKAIIDDPESEDDDDE